MRKKQAIVILTATAMSVTGLTACGGGVATGDGSPKLTDAVIESEHSLSEDDQNVKITLTFDEDISVDSEATDSLRITIGDERESDFTIEQGDDEKSAVITIPVDSIHSGIINIEKSESADNITAITDADGRYAAEDFTVEGTTPSGVTLSTVSSEEVKTVKSVDSTWNLRSIAWIGLYEDGELVETSATSTDDALDGYTALHGHEYLTERETDIAEAMVEVLEKNYDSSYRFSADGSEITVEKTGDTATLDIELYQYIIINGERTELTETLDTEETAEADADSHEDSDEDGEASSGSKVKSTTEDRTPTDEENELIAELLSTQLSGQVGADATDLYSTVKITGNAMPETQIYSLADTEELIRINYVNNAMNSLGLVVSEDGYLGLDLVSSLNTCGVDTDDESLNILFKKTDGKDEVVSLKDLQKSGVQTILAVTDSDGNHEFKYVNIKDGKVVSSDSIDEMIIGSEDTPEDPGYGYHDSEDYQDSEDLTFTIEVYQSGAEYLGAQKTVTLTTKDLEDIMKENPDVVRGGYYGTIGNTELYSYEGVGGYFDYFEGVDLYYLLTEKAGIETFEGTAKLIDRDGECYQEIDDIAYFENAQTSPEEYYTVSSTGLKDTGTIPFIGVTKNGAPILKNHTHDGVGYIGYSTMNQNLENAGVVTEIGVIKNHNGPFIACLGNYDGYYGGKEAETGNNCVTLQVYLK